jgi:redox-sensitive bicupin YhaK (pirin superfamily)
MATLTLSPGARVVLPAPADRSVFFYLVRGAITASGAPVDAQHLVTFAQNADTIEVAWAPAAGKDNGKAPGSDAFLVFGHAAPIGEPVVSHGPFVMTTRQEISEAIADYQAGKFGGL